MVRSERVKYLIERFKNPASLNKQFKLFWIGVGKDDTLTGPATTRSWRRSRNTG